MNTYELLDTIADSYNPILFICYLAYSVIYYKQGDKLAWLRGLSGIVLCYVLMAVDKTYKIWEGLGLDYSTHSAVSLVLIIFLVHKRRYTSKTTFSIISSLFAYYMLVLYQKYHTTADIISTIIVVSIFNYMAYFAINKLAKWKERNK